MSMDVKDVREITSGIVCVGVVWALAWHALAHVARGGDVDALLRALIASVLTALISVGILIGLD